MVWSQDPNMNKGWQLTIPKAFHSGLNSIEILDRELVILLTNVSVKVHPMFWSNNIRKTIKTKYKKTIHPVQRTNNPFWGN